MMKMKGGAEPGLGPQRQPAAGVQRGPGGAAPPYDPPHASGNETPPAPAKRGRRRRAGWHSAPCREPPHRRRLAAEGGAGRGRASGGAGLGPSSAVRAKPAPSEGLFSPHLPPNGFHPPCSKR